MIKIGLPNKSLITGKVYQAPYNLRISFGKTRLSSAVSNI